MEQNGYGEMVFDDLTPITVPVRINNKPYLLHEATEDAASKWRNESMRGARFVNGEVQTVTNVGDLQPLLVSLCLFEQDGNGKLTPVPLAMVRRWPSRMVKKLFDKAKEISELVEEEETEDKLSAAIVKLQTKLNKLRSTRMANELSRSQLGAEQHALPQLPDSPLGNE